MPGKIERVIVRGITRIARNTRDLNRTVGRLTDTNLALHVIDAGLEINEADGSEVGGTLIDDVIVLQLLASAGESEAKLVQERTKAGLAQAEASGKHVGRSPFGFETDEDGYLVPDENFDMALAVIRIDAHRASCRSTARHAGVARSTVQNILDCMHLYTNAA